jgi:hypothetical protein
VYGFGDTERLEDIGIDESSKRILMSASTCLSAALWCKVFESDD